MVYPPTNHQVLSRRPLDSVLSDSVHGGVEEAESIF